MAFLFILLPFVAAGVIFYLYNNKQAKRAAESERRLAALMAEVRAPAATAAKAAAAPAGTPPVAAPFAPAPAAQQRTKLLSQHHALLYYVLRTGLPDHEIFARVELADLVATAPRAAGARRVDFVVCTKQLEIVAAVLLSDGTGGGSEAALMHALERAGVKVVRLDAAGLPRHHEVRGHIYGHAAQAAPKQ